MQVVRERNIVVARGGPDGRHDRAAHGLPEMGPVLDALSGLNRDISGIIEHDLYPCAPDVPLPIAKRTKAYLSTCSAANIDMGVVV